MGIRNLMSYNCDVNGCEKQAMGEYPRYGQHPEGWLFARVELDGKGFRAVLCPLHARRWTALLESTNAEGEDLLGDEL